MANIDPRTLDPKTNQLINGQWYTWRPVAVDQYGNRIGRDESGNEPATDPNASPDTSPGEWVRADLSKGWSAWDIAKVIGYMAAAGAAGNLAYSAVAGAGVPAAAATNATLEGTIAQLAPAAGGAVADVGAGAIAPAVAGGVAAPLAATTTVPMIGALAPGLAPSAAGTAAIASAMAPVAAPAAGGLAGLVGKMGLSTKDYIGLGASAVGGALSTRKTQSTTPTMDPAYGPLQAQVLKMITDRLTNGTDLSGYTGSGISQINKTYGLTKASADNNLTARGLATSPVAANVDATRETARAGDVAGFQNSIPVLQRQLQSEDLSTASGILGLGRGSTTTGTSGGGAAGAATNLAEYLGYLQGKGAFPGSTNAVLPARQTVPNMGMMPGGY